MKSSPVQKKILNLYIDGAARGNPGPAGIGIYLSHQKKTILKEGFFIEKKTNNQAEYIALIIGICHSKHFMHSEDQLHIFTDSQLLVYQIKNIYKVRNHQLQILYSRVCGLLAGISYSIAHIPREENITADLLANEGIDNKRALPLDLKEHCLFHV